VLHVFNPEGIGGLPSTFRWNPVRGCEQPAVALQRAASFTAATESRGLHDMAFWIGKASADLQVPGLPGTRGPDRRPRAATGILRRTRAQQDDGRPVQMPGGSPCSATADR
jgi:hypothetical protein